MEHETAFRNLKQALTSSPILAHYSLDAKTEVLELLITKKGYKMVKPYRAIADELCITDQNTILRSSRIVLPVKLRGRAIMLAHEDHAGKWTRR